MFEAAGNSITTKSIEEVEEKWSAIGSKEKIPLHRTAFSISIEGNTRCILGERFDEQALVDRIYDAYISIWTEMEICIQ